MQVSFLLSCHETKKQVRLALLHCDQQVLNNIHVKGLFVQPLFFAFMLFISLQYFVFLQLNLNSPLSTFSLFIY